MAMSYNPVVLLYVTCTTMLTNFILNYNDVFIIIISFVVVHRFRILYTRIYSVLEQVVHTIPFIP